MLVPERTFKKSPPTSRTLAMVGLNHRAIEVRTYCNPLMT